MKRTALKSRSPLRSKLRAVGLGKNWRKQLDELCRKVVVEVRDKETCQRCGNTKAAGNKIDWAHVKAGRSINLAWIPWASMALCAGCHFYFDANGNGRVGSPSRFWWAGKFPKRDVLLRVWEQQRSRPKFDPLATRLWLEQEIARHDAVD